MSTLRGVLLGGLLVLGVFVLAVGIAYLQEWWQWNGGICRYSGRPWQPVDVDRAGNPYSYRDGVGNVLWTVWKFKRRKV